jgi:hypothetical protein
MCIARGYIMFRGRCNLLLAAGRMWNTVCLLVNSAHTQKYRLSNFVPIFVITQNWLSNFVPIFVITQNFTSPLKMTSKSYKAEQFLVSILYS